MATYIYNGVSNQNGFLEEKGNIKLTDGVSKVLSELALIVERNLQVMELVSGYTQRNRYTIKNSQGYQLGWIH